MTAAADDNQMGSTVRGGCNDFTAGVAKTGLGRNSLGGLRLSPVASDIQLGLDHREGQRARGSWDTLRARVCPGSGIDLWRGVGGHSSRISSASYLPARSAAKSTALREGSEPSTPARMRSIALLVHH